MEKQFSMSKPGSSITITHFLKDGTYKTIAANDTAVWWNDKYTQSRIRKYLSTWRKGFSFWKIYKQIKRLRLTGVTE